MKITKCMCCMEELTDEKGKCPHCGFSEEETPSLPHQLPYRSVLNGTYMVGKAIGEGGFGITYIGWDLNLGIKVAIKEFYPDGFVGRDGSQSHTVRSYQGDSTVFFNKGKDKFLEEARSLGKFMQLEGIVSVKDFFLENNTVYVWAGRIATNLSLRHLQKNKKEELHPTILEEDDDKAYTVFDEAAQDMEAFIPETVLENAEQQRIIAGILEGLSVEQKLCVQYYYFEELSVNDIAKLMQCSTGTVKSRLNYARKSLKEAINTFEIKNDVKLYSMASLPVFLLVFKKAADSLVFSSAAIGAGAIVAGGVVAEEALVGGGTAGTAGAASGSAAGVASGGSVVAGGTAVSGTAVAGTGATAATATGFMATVTGKVAVVVTAVCVSAGSAAVSTEISKNEMMENYGHIITSEEAQESIYSSMNMLSPQSQMAYTQNIQELIGDVEI